MAAGIKYEIDASLQPEEFCNVKTIFRLAGGFNLDLTSLAEGGFLPPMTPLYVNFVTRKATAVKNVKVTENATATATTIKIAKGSLAYIGMILGTGTKGATVTAIDKSNATFDILTLAATFGEAVSSGAVLFEASAAGGTTVKNKANYLNYARTKIEAGATVTAVGQAYEIRESKLITPVSEKDKENLGCRFMFIL